MWQDAMNEFIADYKENPDVEAILLVGSYAVGNNNNYSDIDIFIILNDQAKYRKRGNKLVGNYLIEYFVNRKQDVYKYLDDGVKNHKGSIKNMIQNGIALYDKNNIIKELKKYAKNLPKNNNKDVMLYYACWCAYDEYKAAKYNNHLQYYICLNNLVDCYLVNNGYNKLPNLKIERFFKDKEYLKKYNIKLPNNKFNKLVINCFDDENQNNLKQLYDYVINDGKFDINNFELINEIE